MRKRNEKKGERKRKKMRERTQSYKRRKITKPGVRALAFESA